MPAFYNNMESGGHLGSGSMGRRVEGFGSGDRIESVNVNAFRGSINMSPSEPMLSSTHKDQTFKEQLKEPMRNTFLRQS